MTGPGELLIDEGERYAAIKDVIRSKTGVDLGQDKDYLIPARLSPLLKEFGFGSFDELASALEGGDPTLVENFIERITTHETLFFRDESIFSALVSQIIPEWLERNRMRSTHPLRIWSAACSTGQEPYSIAMLLHSKLPHVFARAEILATDISRQSLSRARQGAYTAYEVGRGLTPELLERYFVPGTGGSHRISEQIRDKVQFAELNLLDSAFPGDFDIVLCRNVLFYFEHSARFAVVDRLRKSMRADACLILGSAETVDGYVDNYVLRECGLARYYEINMSRVTLF